MPMVSKAEMSGGERRRTRLLLRLLRRMSIHGEECRVLGK